MPSPSRSTYDKYPTVKVSNSHELCDVGWAAIAQRLKMTVKPGRFVMCVECYPGCFEDEIERELTVALQPSVVIRTRECYLPENAIVSRCEHDLGDDPVFGFMNHHVISDFLDEREVTRKKEIVSRASGLVLVIGAGASLLAETRDLLVYADMARWEIQKRQR